MNTPLIVPIFKRKDWTRIKSSSVDDIPGTYDDYVSELRRRLSAHKRPDDIVREIEIDFDDMIRFLCANGLANVADNRALYLQLLTVSE